MNHCRSCLNAIKIYSWILKRRHLYITVEKAEQEQEQVLFLNETVL